MRVADKSIFDMVKYQLSEVTQGLVNAQKVVSSGKRITEL